jgi:hypothetical protein
VRINHALTAVLTSTLNEVSSQLHDPISIPPMEEPRAPITSLQAVAKRKIPAHAGNGTKVVEPGA